MSDHVERALWALRAYDTLALATSGEAGPHVAGVFFAPEATGAGIRLLVVTRAGSRLQREMDADPRVAFMCSPGNASRWIQGGGVATAVTEPAMRTDVCTRLVEHAAEARAYVDGPDLLPVVIDVRWLKVVAARDSAPLLVAFDP